MPNDFDDPDDTRYSNTTLTWNLVEREVERE